MAIFLDKEHMVQAVRDFSVQVGADLVRLKVDAKRYTVVCANQDCGWRLHASVLPDKVTWAIKSLSEPHSCHRLEHNPMAGIKWLAGKILDQVRANFEVPCQSLVDLVLDKYGVTVPKSTMYKARAEAVKEIQGAHDESYGHLHIIWINEGPANPLTFKRIYVSFDAMFKGFMKGCRPLIGIDGCHLKGLQWMLAICNSPRWKPTNFPLAYAVVSEESSDNWDYFFRSLRLTLATAERMMDFYE
ncbi:uncharacterized protein LOC130590184 [Beta vulgaris subsp. vulgaris]|uniref:uncharacterized protein LOC130590184 n=1 Tax=Beta vulgaris subsp. vulgaris TaxID=3555 RepID=UPI00254712F5|nr:uncharacterized protein LOC130590184 [Beta vulgaris subsp. vulgaris]